MYCTYGLDATQPTYEGRRFDILKLSTSLSQPILERPFKHARDTKCLALYWNEGCP